MIDFRLILTRFWVVLRIKMGMKMKDDFHIDFLKKFDALLTPFSSIQGHFGVPWGHLGGKMEAKEATCMRNTLAFCFNCSAVV